MPVLPSDTIAIPPSKVSLENVVVQLAVYTDNTHTTVDSTARIYWQRYVQSVHSVFDIAQRSNLAGSESGCINVRFFDPDNVPTKLYHAPTECDPIAHPIQATDTDLQEAYSHGDFSILIEGYDAVNDLGFGIKSLFDNNGNSIPFDQFLPGSIYISPELGMFMFFHYPDCWDDCCSYWEFAWWDTNDIAIVGADTTLPPYVTDWNTLVPVPPITPSYAENPGIFLPRPWDDQVIQGVIKSVGSITRFGSTATVTVSSHGYSTGDFVRMQGANQNEYNGDFRIFVTGINTFTYNVSDTPATPATGVITSTQFSSAQPTWNDIEFPTGTPLPVNTYWNVVSEAPAQAANVIVSYWTQDNTDPLEPRGGGAPSELLNYRNEIYTSPITIATDTQLRFRSVNASSAIEFTKTETYTVGLRLSLQQGVNLISQPYDTSSPEADLDTICSGLDLLQIFRLENGLWQVYSFDLPVRDFTTIDNKHGLFFIMNEPGTFCFPYGTEPISTELALVDKNTNQGINAIAVPRSSLQDNSIDNLLVSRDVQFDEIYRVTNNIFETYIPGRAQVLNFNPTELTPGRGYGIVTSKSQVFELPFID